MAKAFLAPDNAVGRAAAFFAGISFVFGLATGMLVAYGLVAFVGWFFTALCTPAGSPSPVPANTLGEGALLR